MTSKIISYEKNAITGRDGLDDLGDIHAIWRSLNLRISAEPMNIKLHTQRLLFALENNLNDYVAGALQDLYICLGEKGGALRQRMFDLLSPVMVQPDREYFRRWLQAGTDRDLDCHHFPGAVFTSETCHADAELESNSLAPERKLFKNTLEEALYNLESGQIVKGQAMLEDICLQQPGNDDAIQSLQSFYLSTRQEAGLKAFLERYRERHASLPEIWQTFRLETNEHTGKITNN